MFFITKLLYKNTFDVLNKKNYRKSINFQGQICGSGVQDRKKVADHQLSAGSFCCDERFSPKHGRLFGKWGWFTNNLNGRTNGELQMLLVKLKVDDNKLLFTAAIVIF